ncbi:MAG TPA: pseudouridine-5'-phosphate glycosidase [Actinomycetota bacterium]|nr:pseudouridine-5'-phosphate glycosidase [Actinomycetota bacterium]
MPSRSARRGQRIGVAGGGAVSALLRVGDEVVSALADQRAVVGLETSVIGQGLPFPRNVECIERMVDAIRSAGAVPAWVGVLAGEVVVGLTDEELRPYTEPGRADKVARRDLPAACARGALGATTVSASIWAAARAGIVVSATGGIGGVHPGEHLDVSADLVELSRTPGLLVCSGPKSIIDPRATSERLEELGVTMVGYGVSRLPFFLTREAPIDLEHRVDTPDEAAAILAAAIDLDTRSTILLCNPISPAVAMDPAEVANVTRRAEERAATEGIRGRARTPYLLAAIAELTEGRSMEANLALLAANAGLAGDVASVATGIGWSGRRW